MATLDVINLEKQKVGTIDLPDEIVNAPVPEHLFYEVVKAQLASRRAGTVGAKNRSLVSGGGKKPYKQTGIGSALVLGLKDNQNLFKSVRNAKKYQFLPVEGANVYDILRHQILLLTKDAALALTGVLA